MAPTILGKHWRGECEECGKPNYASPFLPGTFEMPGGEFVICENFHITRDKAVSEETHPSDRFLVAKFLTARRWDLLVFRYPEEPSTLYVKRLVGMPGETIVIKDGAVWADGEKLTPPERLGDIEYRTDFFGVNKVWGSPDHPAKLGDGEYFVLGDFTERSKDSRLWSRPAPGHPPYAVPESHLYGVVSHTYWPLDRWRTHR